MMTNQMKVVSRNGPTIAQAIEMLPNTLMGESTKFIGFGDSQPARNGDTPSAITATRMASQVLVALSSTVKDNPKPAPVTKDSPSATMKLFLGEPYSRSFPKQAYRRSVESP